MHPLIFKCEQYAGAPSTSKSRTQTDETGKENYRLHGRHILQKPPQHTRRTLPRMSSLQRICIYAPRQMCLPRQKKHLRQMPNPLLQTRHERKSKNRHALLRTKNDAVSPKFSVASCLGCPTKATCIG